MKIMMCIVMFLFIAGFFIVSNGNLHLNDEKELNAFFTSYSLWAETLLEKGKVITGYVVGSQWLPEKIVSTNSSE